MTGTARRTASAKRDALFVACIAAFVVASYCWFSGAKSGHLTSKQPTGYYGLLTEAFLYGQLHLKIPVNPKLLQLENPYAGPQGVERPHDMSFYRGRFYLYYGVTPSLILFAPWKLVFGSYLSETAGITFFCLGTFLTWAAFVWQVKRTLFPDLSPTWLVVAIAMVGWCGPTFISVPDATFYLIPIAAAAFCFAGTALCILYSLTASTPGKRCAWLAGASFCYGLTVGARPTYVLSGILLAVIAGILVRRHARAKWREAFLIVCSATVPAAAYGASLACYNFFRFENAFDFGIRFSLASGDLRQMRLAGLEFIPEHLRMYLLNPAAGMRYFPFLFTLQRPYGILPHFSVVLLALAFPLTLLWSHARRQLPWVGLGIFLLGSAAVNLTLLSSFFGGEDRYLFDFVPQLVALSALVLLAIAGRREWIGRRVMLGFGSAAAAWSIVNTTLLVPATYPPARLKLAALEKGTNWVVGTIESWSGTEHGPVSLKVAFPDLVDGSTQPLVTTGNMRGVYDTVYVRYLQTGQLQFGFDHLGGAGPVSEPINLERKVPHHLIIDVGSVYPPPTHPFFEQYTPAAVEQVRRNIRIHIGGADILRAAATFYPSTPNSLTIGHAPLAEVNNTFSGEILEFRRIKPEFPPAASLAEGAVRLKLKFPSLRKGPGQPLLSLGKHGAGDLILVKFLDDGRVALAHDSWGASFLVGPPISIEADRKYTLDLDIGALRELDKGVPGTTIADAKLRIRLDGKELFGVVRPSYRVKRDDVVFGFNHIGASSADSTFTGSIVSVTSIAPWAEASIGNGDGAIRMTILLAAESIGRTEPLIALGKTGAADVVFLHRLDNRRIRLGIDHWGVGAVTTEPIEITPEDAQVIEIRLASLNKIPTDTKSIILFDGLPVLELPWPPYPLEPDSIAVGLNSVGSSACEQRFSGTIFSIQRDGRGPSVEEKQ
jgi:hypothetical protein